MIELKDTAELMCSDDWRKRLVAEYAQAKIRAWHVQRDVDIDEAYEEDDVREWLDMGKLNANHEYACLCRFNRVFAEEEILAIVRWVRDGEPLTIFDESQKLVKIKQFPGEPRVVRFWEKVDDHSRFYVEQVKGTRSRLAFGDTYVTQGLAVSCWNERARALNASQSTDLDCLLGDDE